MENIFVRREEEILSLNEREISIERLFSIFKNRPYMTIYITTSELGGGKLEGIITLGDLSRNQLEGKVLVNRSFTKIEEGYEEDAIRILREKTNITSIPIVSSGGRLVKEFYTYNDEKEECVLSDDIIYEVIQETLFFNRNYKNIVFIVTESMRKLLLDEHLENLIILDDSITIEQIKKYAEDRDTCICDFCFESAAIRKVFYEKYHIEYVIWNFAGKEEIKEILNDRAKLYRSIAVLHTKENILYNLLEASNTKIFNFDLEGLRWNRTEQCYEIDTCEEEIESIFTLSCFAKNPYVLINGKMIPVLGLKYFEGLLIESRAVCADIAYNIIPQFERFGVKFIVINTPRYEIDEIAECFTEDISKRKPSWQDMDAVTKFISGDRQLAEELRSIMKPVMRNGFLQIADFSGKYVNCIQNERYTIGNHGKSSHNVYLFGPCIVRGAYVEDKDTLGSILRKKIGEEYSVKNYGNTWITMNYLMRSRAYKSGDVVILFAFDKTIYMRNGIRVYSIIEAYRKIPNVQNHVWENLLHCDRVATKYIADEIYRICESEHVFEKEKAAKGSTEDNRELYFGIRQKTIAIPEQLKKWLSEVKKHKICNAHKSGAIVMNCNPFTRGHRYLIEEAKKQVDVLYIFVVEEDKSFFKFEDRLQMVKLGVADINNVVVIPSGGYIISTQTLPGYFEKEEKPYVELDATDDLELFAGVIAKEFEISVRFAGEEPKDPFTRQYNKEMERILPQFGIEFCEIERKQICGEVISASLVRKCMKEKNYDKIRQLVLPEVYCYLEEHYLKIVEEKHGF